VLPVTLALVDAAGPDDFLDLVRGGLTVAMEALPPGSLFGLIGISDCITLVDMSGQRGAAAAVQVLLVVSYCRLLHRTVPGVQSDAACRLLAAGSMRNQC
jgi:hypothetical protein